MSSRKSSHSSSRGSRRNSTKSGMDLEEFQSALKQGAAKEKKQTIASRIPSFILICAIWGSILYYLYNLEDADCNCIRDWRHNFIKGMCLIIIFLSFVGLFGFDLKSSSFKWIAVIYFILFITVIYAFFTYVGDLNATKCTCAVDKQPNLNSIMNFLRWLYPIIIGLSLLMMLIAFIVLGYSLIKSMGSK